MTKPLNIAIIGGGASGLITGYLLQEAHRVVVFEKEKVLGGNVRTLNQNVPGTSLPEALNIENGVLGFSQVYYPNFHKLLDRLGTDYGGFNPSISLFTEGNFYPADPKLYKKSRRLLSKLIFSASFRNNVHGMMRAQGPLMHHVHSPAVPGSTFKDLPVHSTLMDRFLRALYNLSFSTAPSAVNDLPQTMTNPYLATLGGSTWSFIKGGVYQYMADLLAQSTMEIRLGVNPVKIKREAEGVLVSYNGSEERFDKVVLATTPGAVASILTDLTPVETEVFQNWPDQKFRTIAHTDLGMYGPYKNVSKTPMDLFDRFTSEAQGYNTYMNEFYGLPTQVPYSFAYGLEQHIDSNKVLHDANHTVPRYLSDHDHRLSLIESINGENHTFFAGAYLSNGLHEGAVNSGLAVSETLGGIVW